MAQNKNATVTTEQVAAQVVEAANEVVNAQAVQLAQDAVKPVEVPATEAGAQVPAEVPQQTFAEKHPKVDAALKKTKEVGKKVLKIGAIAAGAIAIFKIGELAGAHNSASSTNDNLDETPDYNEPTNDDLGEDGIEEIKEF